MMMIMMIMMMMMVLKMIQSNSNMKRRIFFLNAEKTMTMVIKDKKAKLSWFIMIFFLVILVFFVNKKAEYIISAKLAEADI